MADAGPGAAPPDPAPLPETLAAFDVTAPTFLAETAAALLWTVDHAGQRAVLKTYKKGHMGNEGTGFDYLTALDGQGVARVYGVRDDAALMEFLPGPALGDLTRAGADDRAAAELVAVANRLHAVTVPNAAHFPTLETWFHDLFHLAFAPDCPDSARRAMARCQALARALLDDPRDLRPLHGDLHQDNIRLADRGYCAFDAKGVVGERAYELANAFRNPKGAADTIRDPARVRFLRDLWSDRFAVVPRRLMQWGVVKAALSITWRLDGRLTDDPEFEVLALFLAILDES